jgi:DNA-binding protein YbaB
VESIRKSNIEMQRKMEKMQKELEDSTLQMNQEAKKTYMSA